MCPEVKYSGESCATLARNGSSESIAREREKGKASTSVGAYLTKLLGAECDRSNTRSISGRGKLCASSRATWDDDFRSDIQRDSKSVKEEYEQCKADTRQWREEGDRQIADTRRRGERAGSDITKADRDESD